jgi:hypothetical protein
LGRLTHLFPSICGNAHFRGCVVAWREMGGPRLGGWLGVNASPFTRHDTTISRCWPYRDKTRLTHAVSVQKNGKSKRTRRFCDHKPRIREQVMGVMGKRLPYNSCECHDGRPLKAHNQRMMNNVLKGKRLARQARCTGLEDSRAGT